MKTRQRQLGMSMIAMLIIAIMVGFFVMCGIRLAPPYFEYLSVKEIIGKIASEPGADEESIAEIRRKIDSLFNTNQIYELQSKDVEVYRKEGKTYIDASYEVRKPIAGNVDAVMKFEDLLYTVGSPVP